MTRPRSAQCLVHLDALADLRHRPPALHRPNIVGRLSLLFGQLGQAVAQDRGALSGEPGTAHPAVVRAMRLLEADLAQDWTLTGLAAELHLAPGYLVRLFNAATGLPPMAYLAQLRAEHAAVLLLHSDEPVTSIGRTVGWPDQSMFARRFKAHYGLSATTYRKRFATRSAHLHYPAEPGRGGLLATGLGADPVDLVERAEKQVLLGRWLISGRRECLVCRCCRRRGWRPSWQVA